MHSTAHVDDALAHWTVGGRSGETEIEIRVIAGRTQLRPLETTRNFALKRQTAT